MQGIVSAMLGMSLFLGSVILSGSQRQSEKQSESDILHFIFLRFHTLTRLFGAHSHSFYAMLGMSLFLGSVILRGSQRQSEKQSESDDGKDF